MAVVCFFNVDYDALHVHTGQGSKLGWSCGPSLPELLSDHQIVLGGGPVVYRNLLTIHFDNIFKMCTDTFYDQCRICFNIATYFQMCCAVASKFCQLCLILSKQNTVSYIRTTRNLTGPPDFQG